MTNKPPPLSRDDNSNPNIKALKRRGFINHGSTVPKFQKLGCIYIYIYIYIDICALYRGNGKENGNYYNGVYRTTGFIAQGLRFFAEQVKGFMLVCRK